LVEKKKEKRKKKKEKRKKKHKAAPLIMLTGCDVRFFSVVSSMDSKSDSNQARSLTGSSVKPQINSKSQPDQNQRVRWR